MINTDSAFLHKVDIVPTVDELLLKVVRRGYAYYVPMKVPQTFHGS